MTKSRPFWRLWRRNSVHPCAKCKNRDSALKISLKLSDFLLPEGKKSVAFNLVLRADDRSLTAQEADDEVKAVLEALEKAFGAALR